MLTLSQHVLLTFVRTPSAVRRVDDVSGQGLGADVQQLQVDDRCPEALAWQIV
jgi:hypothetical protein